MDELIELEARINAELWEGVLVEAGMVALGVGLVLLMVHRFLQLWCK